MNSWIVRCFCLAIFLVIVTLASGVRAQAPEELGNEPGQAPPKEEKSKAREFGRVFCAERSAAIRNLMVNATDCRSVCEYLYQEYPCELQQRLSEGWKVTSVSVASLDVPRDPCDCRVTGTESVLER